MPSAILQVWAENTNILIAADSGADHLVELGRIPDVIIGDMDSLQTPAASLSSKIIRIDDQNLSDCDKMLNWLWDEGHRSVVIAGLEGDRLDHLLAALGSALSSPLRIRLAIRDGVADLLKPGNHKAICTPGQRVSLMPLLPCQNVHISGVQWPLSSQAMSPGGTTSLSNVATEREINIRFEEGALILFRALDSSQIPLWFEEDTV